MPKLVLVRHARSAWNDQNRFTGWIDIPLSKEGIEQAFAVGKQISGMRFDALFTSSLIRAQQSLFLMLSMSKDLRVPYVIHEEKRSSHCSSEVKKNLLPVWTSSALNERYYGDLQGCNKAEVEKKYGKEQFIAWRRGFASRPPQGESLQDTAARCLPWFFKEIIPRLEKEENILIVAHGNSLRSIVMEIENLSEDQVISLEIPTGEPLVFTYAHGKWERSNLLEWE